MKPLYCRALKVADPYRRRMFTCDGYLGESPGDILFVGVVAKRTPRKHIESARKYVYKCPSCGWWNIYVMPSSLTGLREA